MQIISYDTKLRCLHVSLLSSQAAWLIKTTADKKVLHSFEPIRYILPLDSAFPDTTAGCIELIHYKTGDHDDFSPLAIVLRIISKDERRERDLSSFHIMS